MPGRNPLKRANNKVRATDKALVANAGKLKNPVLKQAMRLMSSFGEPWCLYPAAGIGAAKWIADDRKADAATLALCIGGSGVLNNLIKRLVERPRPRITLRRQDTSDSSFPSNHITMSLPTYGALAYMALSQRKRSVKWRFAWFGLVALLILSIGYSRVFLGAHYPSDVVGGWLVGFGWLVLCLMLRRYFSA